MNPWAELGRYGAIGFEIVACLGVGYAGGRWLDLHFSTHGVATMLGLFLGVSAGGLLLWRTARELKRAGRDTPPPQGGEGGHDRKS